MKLKWIYMKTIIAMFLITICTVLFYVKLSELEHLPQKNKLTIKNTLNSTLSKLQPQYVNKTSYKKHINLNDVFISVKTTNVYLESRVDIILKTWYRLAKYQTWFFTDLNNDKYSSLTKGHLINTHCPQSYNRESLCCKMSVELVHFLRHNKKWFCHFDDDNYVNIPVLLKVLRKYNFREDWYLGKKSVKVPVKLYLDSPNERVVEKEHRQKSYWFATGGAGFCLSSTLVLKTMHLAGGGKFMTFGRRLRSPDDVTMGYIVEHLLKVPLTSIDTFHSHLEDLQLLPKENFHEQITLSYAINRKHSNTIQLQGYFPKYQDPSRFLSLHCFLHPKLKMCQNLKTGNDL